MTIIVYLTSMESSGDVYYAVKFDDPLVPLSYFAVYEVRDYTVLGRLANET
jgi:hypothetical protein